MGSNIAWLDFSDSDRRKMIEVVSLFKQRDTRDELGIAQIRDGFAEMFFPGTTTLQTRARYFLFVPWLYRYYEDRRTNSSAIGNPAFDFTALEITRFQEKDTEVLVPHLFGVAKSPSTHGSSKRKRWTEADYFAAAEEALDIETVEFMRDLYTWSRGQADRVWFGSGVERGSYTFHYIKDGKTVSVFSVYTTGILTVNFGALSVILPVAMVEEFRSAFAGIPACASFATDPRHYPSVSIEEKLLNYPEDVESFKKIVIDLGEKVKELQ